jgi:hypothetical protein
MNNSERFVPHSEASIILGLNPRDLYRVVMQEIELYGIRTRVQDGRRFWSLADIMNFITPTGSMN